MKLGFVEKDGGVSASEFEGKVANIWRQWQYSRKSGDSWINWLSIGHVFCTVLPCTAWYEWCE